MRKKNDDFKANIRMADKETIENLAKEFEVAISTVERWGTGISCPHPRLQMMIMEFLRKDI